MVTTTDTEEPYYKNNVSQWCSQPQNVGVNGAAPYVPEGVKQPSQ